MQRVYYTGDEIKMDSRLAGVELARGVAVDVPDALVEELLAADDFSLDAPAPRPTLEIADGEAEADSGIVWYEPPPGEELLGLAGIGPSRADALADLGISTLVDMADLAPDGVAEIADAMPGVSEEQVLAWVEEAEAKKL
jgi:predicted flap endonuclease-1-like 5' DNA nuclease